jgi:hypothetical protein
VKAASTSVHWLNHHAQGIRLAIHFGDRSWLRPVKIKRKSIDRTVAGYWQKHISVLPEIFHAILFDEIMGGERCRVAIGDDGRGGFRVSIEDRGTTGHGIVVLEAHRYWSIADGTIVHGLIRANERMRNSHQTVPARFLRNSFNLYHALGARKVVLTANYESGGYVWAKYGFVPVSDVTWQHLARRLAVRLTKFESDLSEDAYNHVVGLLQNPDPKTIWLISELNERIGGRKLCSALLAGTNWKGSTSLSDPVAIDRFNRYLSQKGVGALSW